LVLNPDAVSSIVEREICERRDAAAEYVSLGRHDEVGVLSSQADVIAALAAEAS
jgi:uncharacterized protein YqeY